MKTRFFLSYVALCLGVAALGQTTKDGPTMGWSSWNTYGINISDKLIKVQADNMVKKGLLDVGYRYINIDDGYFGKRDPETGALLTHPTRFPNGLKDVVDYIHSKGLRAGIYSDVGYNTCGSQGSGDPWGIGSGMYDHQDQDMKWWFGELGFDFIKVDFCGGMQLQDKDKTVCRSMLSRRLPARQGVTRYALISADGLILALGPMVVRALGALLVIFIAHGRV